MLIKFVTMVISLFVGLSAFAKAPALNLLDDLDPNDPKIEEILEAFDRDYEQGTGLPANVNSSFDSMFELFGGPKCVRQECAVWVQVVRSTQTLYLYLDGQLSATWPVSTGLNNSTPNMDHNPNGRIYDQYSSKRFPGGDYKGYGNMPFAVFIYGGYAIHGTAKANWSKLGRPASHGCIRIHPDNAYYFNRLVRQHGIRNVWITVQP